MKRKGFTLVETTIVIIIMGALLYVTFSLSFGYINTMKVKTDKESFANVITDAMAIARTSNYYNGERYSTMSISVMTIGTHTTVSGGEVVGTGAVERMTFIHSSVDVDDGTQATLLVTPYSMGCDLEVDDTPVSGSITFTLQSAISLDEYCYRVDENVCKLTQVSCS